MTQPTPRPSTGARYGTAGRRQRADMDPRERREANANRTDAGLGAYMRLDELGRLAVDLDAVIAALASRGIKAP